MRIVFDTSALDVTFKAHAQRGIGRYVRELWSYFQRRPSSSPSESDALEIVPFDHSMVRGSPLVEQTVQHLPFGRQTARQQLVYPIALRGVTRPGDLVHFPAHMDAPSWGSVPSIITVLDLIPLVCGDLYRRGRAAWRYQFGRFLENRAIRHATGIIAISENTARDVERVLGVPAERIVVTPLGVDEKFFTARQLAQATVEKLRATLGLAPEQQTILYVGGIDPRKNWRQLVEAHAAVIARRPAGPPPILILAGRVEGDDQYPALRQRIEELGTYQQTRLLNCVSDQELLGLYGLCSVFFFPSLYEGFGLTPLEALAAGIPVVSSGTSSMPEVLADAAIMVDPKNLMQCVEAIERVLGDANTAARLAAGGPVQARKFSWERTGELTIKAYQRFCRSRAS